MQQMTFADTEYAGKRKPTCTKWFLMEPPDPKGEGGRPAKLAASAASLA